MQERMQEKIYNSSLVMMFFLRICVIMYGKRIKQLRNELTHAGNYYIQSLHILCRHDTDQQRAQVKGEKCQ